MRRRLRAAIALAAAITGILLLRRGIRRFRGDDDAHSFTSTPGPFPENER